MFVSSRAKLRTGLVVLAATVVAAIGAACANVTAPEGGPEDFESPTVMKITPTNGLVGAKPKDVIIQFSEVINETPRGATDLKGLVFISPKSGETVVDWQRSRILIHPKKGWKPNTVYSVTVSPGIMDLRNNPIDSTIRLVFSTGGPIPDTRLTGVVFDWVLGKGAPRALVEAIAKDSTIYQVLADSAGRYDLRNMPPGRYTVRGYTDRNSNRVLDPTESWDTTSLDIVTSAKAELYTFQHDTVGVRINDMVLQDSGKVLRITFDKPYAASQVITMQTVSVKKADSSEVLMSLVESAPQHAWRDSVLRAQADSVSKKKNADTTAAARAAADSSAARKRRDSLLTVERAERDARRLAALRGNRPPPARDTTPPPKMQRPAVYTELYVTFPEPLAPGSQFRVATNGIRSLSGTTRSPARTLSTPKAEKRDSTAAKRAAAATDSAAARRPAPVKPDTLPIKRDTIPAKPTTTPALPKRDTLSIQRL